MNEQRLVDSDRVDYAIRHLEKNRKNVPKKLWIRKRVQRLS